MPLALVKGVFDPSKEVVNALNRLAEDPRNEVWGLGGLPVKGALDSDEVEDNNGSTAWRDALETLLV